MRFSLQDILTRHGYSVLEAKDGTDALEILASEPEVALVLTDLHMPRLDGLDLLRNLQREGRNPALPVLILTSEVQASAAARARQFGVTGWLIKPVGEHALTQAVDWVLKRR